MKWSKDAVGQCSFKTVDSEAVSYYKATLERVYDGGFTAFQSAKVLHNKDAVNGYLTCDFSSNINNLTCKYQVSIQVFSNQVDTIAHSPIVYSEIYDPSAPPSGDDGSGEGGNDDGNTEDTPSTPPSSDSGNEGNPPSEDTPSVDDGNNDSNTEETPSTPPSSDSGNEGNPPSEDTPSVDDGNNDSNTEETPSTPPSDGTGSGDAGNDEGNTEDAPSTPPSSDSGNEGNLPSEDTPSVDDGNNDSNTEETPSNPPSGDTGSGDVPSTDRGNNDSNVNDTPSNDVPSIDIPSSDAGNNDNSTNNTPNTDTTAPIPTVPTQRVEQQVVLPNGEMGNKISTNGNSQVSVQGKIASGSEFSCAAMNQGEEYNRAANAVTARFGNTSFAAFDLNLTDAAGNKMTTFEGTVDVQMPVPEGLVIPEGHTINVYYLAEDGTLSKCDTTVQNGMVTFTTNHFSTYVYVVEPVQAAAEPQPEAPKAEENNVPAPEVVAPKTGDNMLVEWAVVLMLVLAAGSVVLKKTNRI